MSIHRFLTVYETHKQAKLAKFRNLTLKNDLLTLKWTQVMFEIKLLVLKYPYPYMDPVIISLALQEVTIPQELSEFRNLTLKYDLFDLEADFRFCRKWHHRCRCLQNPYANHEIISLSLLAVTETQKREKSVKFRHFDLEISPFDLEEDLTCCWKWYCGTRSPQKRLYTSWDHISIPSRTEVTLAQDSS